MAITGPISIFDFWNRLVLTGTPFQLTTYDNTSIDGGGNMLTKRAAPPRWTASFTMSEMPYDDARAVEAMFKVIRARDMTFLAYDKTTKYPLNDPDGSIISGSTVQVKSKGSNNRSLSLKGLPNGYVIAVGDKFSVETGTGQRVLLEAIESVTATIAGETSEFEVVPFLPTGLAVNDEVNFSRPLAKCKFAKGSFKGSNADGVFTSGASFSIYSVLT